MRFEVRGKNIEVTEALRDYVEKRLSKLEKFIEDARVAQVTLSVEGESHKVEVTIPLNGVILRGEEETEDMYSSIDLVVDKLEKQIDKYKTKLYRRYRGIGFETWYASWSLPVNRLNSSRSFAPKVCSKAHGC